MAKHDHYGHKQHHHSHHTGHSHPVMKAAREGRKHGGGVGDDDNKVGGEHMGKEEVYAGKGSEVEKEAEEKKTGGRVKKAKGGMVVSGGIKRARLDRPGRKRGGRAGADMSPLTTASKIKPAEGHSAMSGNAEEGP